MLAPGAKIDRYELVTPVGEGGMAEVWVARQEGKHGFSKLFALKAIQQRIADDPLFHKMFLDEARIAAAIEHPNVAQVFDLGDHDGLLYLVMEYVDGESLAAILSGIARRTNQHATVPPAIALRIIADVCAGLNAAHRLKDADGKARDVVHRDVSPQNILISVKGDVKLIDFGIAKAAGRLGGDTSVDSVKGKLQYMPAEQARQAKLGPYTDVYSAGAVLYRMLAGRPPYDGDSEAVTLNLLLSGAAPPPLPEDVPPLVASIVERAMSPDPGDRYGSALSMHGAIEAVIAEEGYVPDVATWVLNNLSPRYGERAMRIAQRAAVPSVPENLPIDKTMPSTYSVQPSRLPLASGVKSRATPAEVPDLDVPAALQPRAETVETAEPAPGSEDVPLSLEPGFAPKPPAHEVRSFSAAAEPLPEPAPPPPAPKALPFANTVPASDAEPRSFMDVGAIAAQRKADAERPKESPPRDARPASDAEARGDAAADAPGSGASPASAKVGTKKPPPAPAPAKKPPWTLVAIVSGGLAVLAVAALLVVPVVVRSKIIGAAQAAGIELEIDGISVGLSGVVLRDVSARAPSVPGLEVRAAQIAASGTSGDAITISGVDAKITGRVDAVAPAILRLYEQNRGRMTPSGPKPRRVSLVSGHVGWTEPFGAGTKLDAGEVGVEIDVKGPGSEESRATVGRFEVTTKKTVLGPWTGSFEKSRARTRVRIAFDPPVPDGPSAVYVWGPGTAPHLTVKIPRTPLANLGVRPAELGLPGDAATELEVKIEGGTTPIGRIEGGGKIDLWAARVKGWKPPVDVHLEGSASGAPGKALDLERASAKVGPFAAAVTGTLTPHDAGFRLDATWRTAPIACEKMAKAEAKTLGTLAQTIQELAHDTGAVRVTGMAYAAGLVHYDTSAPEDGGLTFQTRESCGLSIFGL